MRGRVVMEKTFCRGRGEKKKLKNGELGAGACPCLCSLTSYTAAWISGSGFL